MIQLKTMLNCIDNSGAILVECAAKIKMKRHATVGDRIVVVVQRARTYNENPTSGSGSGGGMASVAAANKVKRGDVRHAVVVRTRKKIQRKDGSVIRFDNNACCLVGKNGEPLGTRINGAVCNELRERGQSKILSLATARV